MRKYSIAGIVILLVIVLLSGGPAKFATVLGSLATGTWELLKSLVSLAIKFPDELGVTDYIRAWAFFLIITLLFSTLGIYLTKRQSGKLLQICSFAVSAISLILTFCSI